MNDYRMPEEVKSGHWFYALLTGLAPKPEDVVVTGTPEEMIAEAAKKAFWVSTSLGAVPGPLGLATILPEISAVTKIQIGLVHKIAKYHHKLETLNHSILLLVFANALGLAVGNQLVRRVGVRLVVRALSAPIIERIARAIGLQIAAKITQRIAGRWVVLIAAPLFGLFSRKMTQKIGREAQDLFAGVIEIELAPPDIRGREMPPAPAFNPESGKKGPDGDGRIYDL
jgi:hypothetical protein